jgi:hypothetical protein
MQIIGNIIGFLLAFIIYVVQTILRPFFKLLGFKNVKRAKPPQLKKISKEESFKKGEEFEQYVRDHLFTRERFVLVERTHNYQTNSADFVESTLKPDFKFRSKSSNTEFYIEAKWRQNLHNNTLKWSYDAQFERYKKYARENPFFIVIGLGGAPSNPEKIYLGRIDEMDDIKIYKDELEQYEFLVQANRYKLN